MKRLKAIVLATAFSVSSHAQTPDHLHQEEISALKAETSRLASDQQDLQKLSKKLDEKIDQVKADIKPTECRWSDWASKGGLETNINCWEGYFMQGVGFYHKHGENLSFQESVRILCCKIKN